MKEKRVHDRCAAPLEIKVTWPGVESVTGVSKDFSDGGAFVHVHFARTPEIGMEMTLQLNSMVNGKEAPVLCGKVVRVASDGIAFQFIHYRPSTK